jgi:hypothetical protein
MAWEKDDYRKAIDYLAEFIRWLEDIEKERKGEKKYETLISRQLRQNNEDT